MRRLCRPPRVPHAEMRTLTAVQARHLIHATETDSLRALYAVALASGARQGELLALRWADCDLRAGTIRITRTLDRGARGWTFTEPKMASSRRTVPIGPTALEALRRHRKAQTEQRLRLGAAWTDLDLVFPSVVGTPLNGSNLLTRHYALLAGAGLPRVTWHDLRHSTATMLLEAGVHPRMVAERLGHATPSLVMNLYGLVTERMQGEATAATEAALRR